MERTGVFCGQTDTLPADQAGRVFLSEEEQMHKEEQMQLSPSQEQAVRHGSGPALVLAGPGSGKTFVITRRVACLIHEEHADPAGILVVTFSRAAARTMRKRYLGLTGNDGGDTGTPVVFGTFHSVFFQILKAAYHYTAANILKEEQRVQILRDLINGYRIEGNDRKELMENLSAEISRVKNEEIDLQYFYSSVTASDTFRQVFRSYQQALEAAGLIDFDDMLIYTKQLLEGRADILEAWQKRFTHILVDEFQDINLLQYRIIRMLASPQNNLFVVGDDDQSIYRFRGAKPEIMLGFTKDYPDAELIRLQENYRSGDEVIHAAMKVISANKSRYPKQIRGVRGEPGSVRVVRLKDVREESEFLIRQIRDAVKEGMAYSDMAVLTRTNAAGRYLASRFLAWQIPFVMRDAAPDLYAHWVAQDILSYIRFAAAGAARSDFLQIMNRPLRYISRDCVDTAVVDFDRLCMWYEDKPWMEARIRDLENDIRSIRKMRPFAAVNYIRKAVGYDDFIMTFARERGLDADELLEIAGEVQEDAGNYQTFAEWSAGIDREREEQRQARRETDATAGSGNGPEEDRLLLCTLHSAKGLEFRQVFLPDVNEGMLPWRRASLESEIEEERRLLYVGMTRAKDSLHIMYVQDRFGKEQKPSRFLQALAGNRTGP